MTQTKQVRVHVIDDDEAVRDSVSMLLETVELDHALYPSAQAFLDKLGDSPRGCLVVDIRMPGMSGLELQNELARLGVGLPIIFITGHGDIPMAVEAMRRGALDFIRKPFPDEELLGRIHEALDMEAADRASQVARDAIESRFKTLSPREREVFERVAAGQANKVIAIELGISERTVEIHRAQVMRKMETRTLAQLVRIKIVLEEAH